MTELSPHRLRVPRARPAAGFLRTPGYCGWPDGVEARIPWRTRQSLARLPWLYDNDILYYAGALTHDISKIGMPDTILKGRGLLNAEERALVRQHVEDGHDLLKYLNMPVIMLDIVRYHHERFNGSGYPIGSIWTGDSTCRTNSCYNRHLLRSYIGSTVFQGCVA
ncbi:HD-GYP domain-containing protein [Paenibacillus sp. D51F]